MMRGKIGRPGLIVPGRDETIAEMLIEREREKAYQKQCVEETEAILENPLFEFELEELCRKKGE